MAGAEVPSLEGGREVNVRKISVIVGICEKNRCVFFEKINRGKVKSSENLAIL